MPAAIVDGLRQEQRAEQWRRWFLLDHPMRGALTVCEDDDEVVSFAAAVIPPDGTEVELHAALVEDPDGNVILLTAEPVAE